IVFIIMAVGFMGTILALAFMRVSDLHTLKRLPKEKGQIKAGIRYILARQDIMAILVVITVTSAFGLNFQMTSALMANNVFGKGAEAYGMLGSIMAIGSLGGALIAARRRRPR